MLLITNNLGVIRGLFVDMAPLPKEKEKKTASPHLYTATLAAL